MTRVKITTTVAALVLALITVTGCAPGSGGSPVAVEPTITAIPLPTWTPTEITKATATSLSKATAGPTETTASTSTPPLEPTNTTPPQPTATATPVPPTPTAEPSPTPQPKPKVTRSQPRPTATPEFTGKLVFQTTIGGSLYAINADGTGLRRITDGADAVWSPDGSQIAFTRWRDPRGVWVINADGSNERRVFDWGEARWPSWSPDEQQILFSRQHGGRTEDKERCFWGFCFDIPAKPHWRLGIVRPAGGSFAEPPSPIISLAPDWSPEGDRIVFDGEQGLVIQSVDGQVSYQITHDARDTSPIWSPVPPGGDTGGSRVAFTRHQHDHWEIYVVDADGRNLARLTDTPTRPDGTPGSSAAPAWSPDGRYIAFLTDRTGKWEIWIMKVDGSGQKPMFESALDGLILEYASVAERAISWTR